MQGIEDLRHTALAVEAQSINAVLTCIPPSDILLIPARYIRYFLGQEVWMKLMYNIESLGTSERMIA